MTRSIVGVMQAVRDRLQVLVGAVAELILPALAREIDAGRSSGRALKLKRAIVRSRLRRAEWRNDPAAIEQALQAYWRSDVNEGFYAAFVARFDGWFHGPHYRLVDALAEAVAANPSLDRLVEVGCGDGRALAHLAERLPRLRELVGLDINARIIARNVGVHGDRLRLRFVQTDARRWLAEETRDGTILFSYGGVLEYVSEPELAAIFARLGRQRDTAVALVEPVDPRHNLTSDAGSHPHGLERSFSHNHLALLAAAGFTIRFAEELTVDGIRWMMILAVSPDSVARTHANFIS
jgi:SAM-dependent methyltransferase